MLAFYITELITAVKSFMIQAPGLLEFILPVGIFFVCQNAPMSVRMLLVCRNAARL
jgi:hypothetical protein